MVFQLFSGDHADFYCTSAMCHVIARFVILTWKFIATPARPLRQSLLLYISVVSFGCKLN